MNSDDRVSFDLPAVFVIPRVRLEPGEHADPLQLIEMLYADFGYPTEIETLVRYMPATPGAPTGVMALEERWTDYLRQKSSENAMRR